MPDLLIRQVTPSDLDRCFAIESLCYGPEGATRERIQIRIGEYSEGFLVAQRQDGLILGFVNSGATNKDDITDEAFKALVGHDPAGRNAVIFSLAVHPDFRKQGIAAALMNRFIEQMRVLERTAILLLCHVELIAYYQRFGFVHLGASASDHGGLHWHEMKLSLR